MTSALAPRSSGQDRHLRPALRRLAALPLASLRAAHHGLQELPGSEPGHHVAVPVASQLRQLHPGMARRRFGGHERPCRELHEQRLPGVPATLLSAVLGSLNGYVLSKWKFRGANVVFPLILFGMFIPYQSILIPLVRVLQTIAPLRDPRGADIRSRRLRDPHHDADLPQLLRRDTRRADRGEQDRRRGDPRHLREYPLSPVAPGIRRRHDLAVHVHLERLPLRP